MNKLVLGLVFTVVAFAQHRGPAPQQHAAPPQHQQQHQYHFNAPTVQRFSPNGWYQFGRPGMQPGMQRPMPHRSPILVTTRPVIVRPYVNYGVYPWSVYYGMGYWPYYSQYFAPDGILMYRQPQPCKKETLKDSNGNKHEILICIQPDGSTQVTDANAFVPAPCTLSPCIWTPPTPAPTK